MVALVVILFLQTWRAAIIPIVAIPVSLVGTKAMFGFSLSNLPLFGLVLAVGTTIILKPFRCYAEALFLPSFHFHDVKSCSVRGACMALTLRDVRRDPSANRALGELTRRYIVAEEKSGLVLTLKAGKMKLFLNNLDDLHQWDFVRNQKLRAFLRTIDEQRETWKRRALMAEAKLVEVSANISENDGSQNVSDLRYAALKRYLAKQFHPDYAPGRGIEKIVRNEIFKEIWSEIDRLGHQSVSACSTSARSSSAS